MHNFKYVNKNEYSQTRKEVEELINLVQGEVRKYFTFSFEPIGSLPRNMITQDIKSNIGYDFDYNLYPNVDFDEYLPKDLKNILIKAFNKHSRKFKYDYCEDSKRVITIKVKDQKNSKILHSCDFAIVRDWWDDDDDWHQYYVYFNKKQKKYEWQEQPDGFYDLTNKIDWCKENDLWQEVRDKYLVKKNKNGDVNKKSRSIFAETINNICKENGYEEE